jgi:hypothetical protein
VSGAWVGDGLIVVAPGLAEPSIAPTSVRTPGVWRVELTCMSVTGHPSMASAEAGACPGGLGSVPPGHKKAFTCAKVSGVLSAD